jgi:hypothetical protein
MVVHDFDTVGVGIPPLEADSVAVVSSSSRVAMVSLGRPIHANQHACQISMEGDRIVGPTCLSAEVRID